MLQATFAHLPGIGSASERRLWDGGVVTWDRFRRIRPWFMSEETYRAACAALEESVVMLRQGDVAYFLSRLDGILKARVLSDFKDSLVYLDVETDGLGPEARPTVVALYDGRSVRTFTGCREMGKLRQALSTALLVVTYNGDRFDLPVLRRAAGLSLTAAHLDLCPLLRAIGYRGGLKECERLAGISGRPSAVNGARAVRLWEAWERTGDERAMLLLRAYNSFDVVSLEILAWKAYSRSMERYPKRVRLPLFHTPAIDFDPAWEEVVPHAADHKIL